MTNGELMLYTFAVLYVAGLIAGGIIGAARGSTAFGILAAMLLGPLFGVMYVALAKMPTSATSPASPRPTQP